MPAVVSVAAPPRATAAPDACGPTGPIDTTDKTANTHTGPATPRAAPGLIPIPSCTFRMGNDDDEAFDEDGEGPSRLVALSAYRIGATAVSNLEFGAFVRATGFVTDAERLGSSFVFHLQVPAAQRDGLHQRPPGLPWWRVVPDACWQRPEGPASHIYQRLDHPVVHVSWHDAQAYCRWAGVRLPTEAEWECAARGGLVARRLPWGDELAPAGQRRCNTWQGRFPDEPAPGWLPGTVPVDAFAPNGLGLFNVSGNVWEWCEDWFDPAYHQATTGLDPLSRFASGRRSSRGGSFLCHDSYCHRYRVAARGSNSPSSSTSHTGFRVAAAADGPG